MDPSAVNGSIAALLIALVIPASGAADQCSNPPMAGFKRGLLPQPSIQASTADIRTMRVAGRPIPNPCKSDLTGPWPTPFDLQLFTIEGAVLRYIRAGDFLALWIQDDRGVVRVDIPRASCLEGHPFRREIESLTRKILSRLHSEGLPITGLTVRVTAFGYHVCDWADKPVAQLSPVIGLEILPNPHQGTIDMHWSKPKKN